MKHMRDRLLDERRGSDMARKLEEGVKVHRVLLVLGVVALVATVSFPVSADPPSSEEVRTFPGPGSVVAGANATLVRQPDGASFTFAGRGLTPGNAYTIWFVAFDSPEDCDFPMMDGAVLISLCGVRDLFETPASQPTAVWGAGHVVGGSGNANLGGKVAVGDTSGCDALGRLPCNDGLTDPQGAEIHLVLRTHGPAIPQLVDEQIHSFNRGCEAGEPNEPNFGLCRNVQFAAFLP